LDIRTCPKLSWSNKLLGMKLIGYVRVSSVSQTQGYGLEVQRQAIEQYCAIHGHELLEIEEEVRSAIKTRPVFDKVKEKVLNGKADGLIAYRLDRVGRSVKDLANIADEFQKAGKALIFVQNAIDTSTPEGKLLFNLLAAIAEYERTLLLERTRAGRELAEKQGKICHRPRKLLDPKILTEMKRKGMSHRMMARTLGVSRATLLRRLDELGLR
jgi:DNA invertase Pin-like site-specific DNA recombinase